MLHLALLHTLRLSVLACDEKGLDAFRPDGLFYFVLLSLTVTTCPSLRLLSISFGLVMLQGLKRLACSTGLLARLAARSARSPGFVDYVGCFL